MTSKEAYEILERYISCSNNECPPVDCDECHCHVTAKQLDEALQMALEALKEPKQPDHIVGVSKKDGENGDDLIRREDALMSLTGEWKESRDEILSKAIRRIKRLPSVQPESFDPRADVYYLAEKIGIHQLYALVVELRGEPESCGDAVSRQKLKDGFKEMCDLNCPYTEKQQHLMCGSCMMGTAFDVLEATPSVQPEQNDAEFWHKRSDEYEKMFFDLCWRMMNGVKFESMQFDKNGITLKMKEPFREDNT